MKKNLKDTITETMHNKSVLRKRLITAGEIKGNIATCNYAWLEKGKQLETHSHTDGEEFYLFLKGKGEILVGEDWIPIKKDDFMIIPKGYSHSLKNNNKQELVFITIRTILEL